MLALAAPERGAGLANARMRERATHACFVFMFALAAPERGAGLANARMRERVTPSEFGGFRSA